MTTQPVTDQAAEPASEPAPLKLTLVGTDDAGVCVDGVCSIPSE